MIRLLSAAGIALLAFVSFGLYNGVHSATSHERELSALREQVVREREAIRVLKAEWTYLNQAERLQALARRHLALAPTGPGQFTVLASLPTRAEAWGFPPPIVDVSDLPVRPAPAAEGQR